MADLQKPISKRWQEFFEGPNGQLSMSRLLCFITIFPASYVLCSTQTAEVLDWYLGAYVLGYVGGKVSDVFKKNDTPIS